MIDRPAAVLAAQAFVSALRRGDQADPLVLRDDLTIERPFGWVFFYDSARYVDTKDRRFAVNGNAPIIVDRQDGSVHPTGTARPIDEYIATYEKTRIRTDDPKNG